MSDNPFPSTTSRLSEMEHNVEKASEAMTTFQREVDAASRVSLALGDSFKNLDGAIRGGVNKGLDAVALGDGDLSDVLKNTFSAVSKAAYRNARDPISDAITGWITGGLSSFGSGLGAAITPFAKGGVVDRTTPFGMAGGLGVMGEAGPEAILPLSRSADGKLGVRSLGAGGAPNINIHIATPDVEGFRRSQSQIAAQVSRALGHGARNQ